MKFIVSLITIDNDYQVEQADAARKTAMDLNVGLEIVYADNDAINQSQQLLKIIQTRPDLRPAGIILESAGGTALPQVAHAAAKAGIAWVVLNRDVAYIADLRRVYLTPIFCVSADNKLIGCIQAEQCRALLPNGGSVLYIQGPSDSVPAALRTAGMLETKGDVKVKLIRAQWTEDSAYRAISSWLLLSISRESRMDVIAAQNDAMALGARKAFEEQPTDQRCRWLGLPFLGTDGVRKTGLDWVKQGLLRATVVVPANANIALGMLVHAIESGTIPPAMTTVAPVGFPSLEQLARSLPNGRDRR